VYQWPQLSITLIKEHDPDPESWTQIRIKKVMRIRSTLFFRPIESINDRLIFCTTVEVSAFMTI
jgi:hypothetical protein